jgi:hypothetical protein
VDPGNQKDVQQPVRRFNWTTIALIAGLILLLVLVGYFATTRNPDQDKLIGNEVIEAQPQSTAEKLCSSKATYDLIKRELFRRAAQLRGSDQAAYNQLAAYAVVRMENAVMESEDSATGAVNCSGSLSLDLPPGVAVAGGRRTLTADVDYSVQPRGAAVELRSGDAIVAQLSTLARVVQPPEGAPEANEVMPEAVDGNFVVPELGPVPTPAPVPAPAPPQPAPANRYPGRPSFDCSQANSRGEIAVCSDSGLSALDLNMARQYRRALASASPHERELLEQTRLRFLGYRDRCRDRQCVADAYLGRMREIRDIMEGRWRAPR